MGYSEWGFLTNRLEDIRTLAQLIQEHNTQPLNSNTRGGYLHICRIFEYEGDVYTCIFNIDGRDNTNNFFKTKDYEADFPPFQKPDWWSDNKINVLWSVGSAKGIREFLEEFKWTSEVIV